jgi:hypothetical protein
MTIGGFGEAIGGFIILGTGLHRRFARNNKSMADRAGFGRRFRTPGGFCRRSFIPFSIQHK